MTKILLFLYCVSVDWPVLGRIATLRMRPIVTDGVAWSIFQPVGLSVTTGSPAKVAEPIVMPIGMLTRTGP